MAGTTPSSPSNSGKKSSRSHHAAGMWALGAAGVTALATIIAAVIASNPSKTESRSFATERSSSNPVSQGEMPSIVPEPSTSTPPPRELDMPDLIAHLKAAGFDVDPIIEMAASEEEPQTRIQYQRYYDAKTGRDVIVLKKTIDGKPVEMAPEEEAAVRRFVQENLEGTGGSVAPDED